MRLFFSRWLELYALFRAADVSKVLHHSESTRSSQLERVSSDNYSHHEQSVEQTLRMLENTSEADIEECLPQLGNLIVNMQSQPALLKGEVAPISPLAPKRLTSFFRRTKMIRGNYENGNHYIRSVSIVSTQPAQYSSMQQSSFLSSNLDRHGRSDLSRYRHHQTITISRHCLSFMRQSLEDSIIRKCVENPVIAIKFAWILEDMASSSMEKSDRCRSLGDICRRVGSQSLSKEGELLSTQAQNAATFLDQLIHISREVCHLKFSKTTAVTPELLSIVAKARIEWLNRNLLLNTCILGRLVPTKPSGGVIGEAEVDDEHSIQQELFSQSEFNANKQGSFLSPKSGVGYQLDQLEKALSLEHESLLGQFALPLLVVPENYRAMKILRLVEEETLILNSASRSPIMITLELLECENTTTLGCITNCSGSLSKSSENTSEERGYRSFPLNEVNPSWLEDLITRTHHSSGESNGVGQQTAPSSQEQMAIQVLWQGWGEIWSEKVKRIQAASPYGRLKGWRLGSFVVKEGDDLRQEKLAMQFIELFQKIWQQHNVGVYVRPYAVMCCGAQCGLLENVVSARSLDSLKKNTGCQDLSHLFMMMFGMSDGLSLARENFIRSLAAYSVISYILQVKDRHNGNILLDTSGHLIHIDYGFILGNSPGRNLGWERAPFKLTREFCDLIGEVGSPSWFEFEHMIVDAFSALQVHVSSIVQLALISLPDDAESEEIVELLRLRIMTPPFEVRSLIAESVDNFFTKSYDLLQRQQNGIL